MISTWFKKYSQEDKNVLYFVKNVFGVKPKSLKYYKRALRHKSLVKVEADKTHNERLEFLGDAVLDSIVAQYLFQNFPKENEGFLTKMKSRIVSRQHLIELAKALHIDKQVKFYSNRGINKDSLAGNALEALVGAVYLDQGYEKTEKVIHQSILNRFVNLDKLINTENDFKSQILIWSQREKCHLEFKVDTEKDLGHRRQYNMSLWLDGQRFSQGVGFSKKQAEQNASRIAWDLLGLTKA